MPIYEYRCSHCGHELEALQRLSDAPLTVCPACSRSALTKLVSAAGFQLKGTGWYATDFKHSGRKPPAKSTESGADSSGSESKADAKSEGKNEAGSTDSKTETKESKTETKKTATAASSGSE